MRPPRTMGLVVAFAVGCSSFEASEGPQPGPDGDAGAAHDGASPDAGRAVDGGGGLTWCQTQNHRLCEDFDHGSKATPPWTLNDRSGTSRLRDDGVSKPGALEMTTSAQFGPALSAGFPSGSPHVRCGLTVWGITIPKGRYALLLAVRSADESRELTLRVTETRKVYLTSTGSPLDGGAAEVYFDLGDLGAEWTDVSFEVTRDADTGRQHVTARVGTHETGGTLDAADLAMPYANVEIALTMNLSTPDDPWTVAVDDVFCDPLP